MASRSVVFNDDVSKESNQTHVNQTIDMSGAVVSLTSALLVGVRGTEIPTRSMQPRNQRGRIPQRFVFIAATIRFARLCVLIEPNPARRSIHLDLAGFSTFSRALRRACP